MPVPEDIADVLSKYPGPARTRPPGWPTPPPRLPWPPFNSWPPDPADMAVAAFGVLTTAYAEGMAAAAMQRVEARCDEINARIDADNEGQGPLNETPNIGWRHQVACLMNIHPANTGNWRRRPWRMQFEDFCRLALIFGLRLDQMPAPNDPGALLDQAFARAMNWILLQLRDGPLPRPTAAVTPQLLADLETAFAQEDGESLEAPGAEGAEDEGAEDEGAEDESAEDESAKDPCPRANAVLRRVANGWMPPIRVHRQRVYLRSIVRAPVGEFWRFITDQFRGAARTQVQHLLGQQQYDNVLALLRWLSLPDPAPAGQEVVGHFRRAGLLAFVQQQFDRRVRELLAAGGYDELVRMVGSVPSADGPLIQRLRTDVLTVAEYEHYFEHNPTGTDPPVDQETIDEITAAYREEHLDAYEVLLDLLFLLPPLDPLGEDPLDPDRAAAPHPEQCAAALKNQR